jgi:hypothetical protein
VGGDRWRKRPGLLSIDHEAFWARGPSEAERLVGDVLMPPPDNGWVVKLRSETLRATC